MSKLIANCFLGMVLIIMLPACERISISQAALTTPNTLLYDTYSDELRSVIYQFDMETQTSRLWLAGAGHLSRPLRSPDRTQVAYLVWNEIDEYFSLWVAEANGQNARQLSDTHLCADGPMVEWSFDSRYIAFRSTPGNNTAYIHILDTTTGQEVLFIGGSEFEWSPTASRLIVSSGGGLVLIDIPTGTEQWLRNDIFRTELYISEPQHVLGWLPDGRTIVFVGAKRDTLHRSIYAVNIDGSDFRNLIPDATQLPNQYIGSIQVSPDGKYVLGASSSSQLLLVEISSGEVHTLASGLSGPTVWAPDSASIVFGSYQDPTGGPKVRTWELFQVALADGVITRLTYDGAAPVGLTW